MGDCVRVFRRFCRFADAFGLPLNDLCARFSLGNTLSRDEIQSALGASRAIPVDVPNSHGPPGLQQLAAVVQQRVHPSPPEANQIQRSISLPLETWEKLDGLAQELTRSASKHVSVSDIAASLVMQGIDTVASS